MPRRKQETGWRKIWHSIRGFDSRETAPTSPRKKAKPQVAGKDAQADAGTFKAKSPFSPRRNRPDPAVPDMVTDRISKLEDELQSVRRELHTLKNEFSELRSKRPAGTDKDAGSPLPVEKIRRILGCGASSSAKESTGPGGLGGWLGSLMCPQGEAHHDDGGSSCTGSEIVPLKQPHARAQEMVSDHRKTPPGAGVGYAEEEEEASFSHTNPSVSGLGTSGGPTAPYSSATTSTHAPASVSPRDFNWNAITPPLSPAPHSGRNQMSAMPPPPPQVPPGWTAEWSRGKNAYYYVNEATQESTWELPSQRLSPQFDAHTAPYSPPTINGSSQLRSAAAGSAMMPPTSAVSSGPSSTWGTQARHMPAPPVSISGQTGPSPLSPRSPLRSVDEWGGSAAPPKNRGGFESSAAGGFQLPFPEAEGLDLPSPARGRVSPRNNFAGQIQSSNDVNQGPLQSAMRSGQPGGAGRVRRLEFNDRIM
eukprot:gnl/MRDRNA2_/MRDRNA2_41660_c0_seq1.p1 gnl/MRDRNA2_/MRDRNA2_41660_c0~~gnl/MRDRNA2_/MRDRNA2_41660_c0_seq1.p1  ORF type:complete len:477 (+),score=74.26 gnl/MRDRNA2_/MRDRNA2_41660_c0_seq1:85-1515(+)